MRRLVLNAEHGSGFVAPLGQLVEEHQLLDVAVGADPAGQVCLESNQWTFTQVQLNEELLPIDKLQL